MRPLTVKDEADPLLPMKGVKNETELGPTTAGPSADAVAMVRFRKELEERLPPVEELTELTVDEILPKVPLAQDKFIVELRYHCSHGGNAAMMDYHATEADHKAGKRGFCWWTAVLTMDGTTYDITRTYPLWERPRTSCFILGLCVCHRHRKGRLAELLRWSYAGHHRPRAAVAAPHQLPLRHLRPQCQLCGQCP